MATMSDDTTDYTGTLRFIKRVALVTLFSEIAYWIVKAAGG